jgi:uncharacterized membrane protein YdjX (TVP38/TMEM64 family)
MAVAFDGSLARRVAVFVAACAVVVLGVRFLGAHVTQLSANLESLGAWGPLLFILGYAVVGMVFVPASLMTLIAGAIFGFAHGLAYAFAGAMLGAIASFLVARHVARGLVERRIATHPRIAAVVDGMTEHGRRIVFLLRLSPVIPYSVINYSMGVTRIPLADFLIASPGMLPVHAVYAYYGAVAGSIAKATQGNVRRGPAYYAVLAAGLVATAIATVLVTRATSRALGALHAKPSA